MKIVYQRKLIKTTESESESVNLVGAYPRRHLDDDQSTYPTFLISSNEPIKQGLHLNMIGSRKINTQSMFQGSHEKMLCI